MSLEWRLEYLQFYRRYHCRLPLRKGREETFIPDFNHWSIFFIFHFFQSSVLSWYWIEPLLNFRDVCLLDTSNGLFWSLFNNRKYLCCTCCDRYDMYVKLFCSILLCHVIKFSIVLLAKFCISVSVSTHFPFLSSTLLMT